MPAKIVSFKHEDNVVQKLNAIEWWNWDESKIKEQVNDFYLLIEEFLKKHHSS